MSDLTQALVWARGFVARQLDPNADPEELPSEMPQYIAALLEEHERAEEETRLRWQLVENYAASTERDAADATLWRRLKPHLFLEEVWTLTHERRGWYLTTNEFDTDTPETIDAAVDSLPDQQEAQP